MSSLADRIKQLEESIAAKLSEMGRNPHDCLLLAVTKTHSAKEIFPALQAGIKAIGENKVQEASAKVPELRELCAAEGLSFDFHFIGHLQRNKVRQLLPLQPVLIHSVDSVALAEELSRQNAKLFPGRVQDILLQVNTSGESSKGGFGASELKQAVDEILKYSNIRICGLMTIGLLAEDTEDARAGFGKLKELFDMLKRDYQVLELTWLSMGMTDDYLVALEEGSNLVRIGSAIFGARDYGRVL
ncbi:MAG TPA: YggS family pyridoxal phosphate-dependent enzyme [Candidatus Cloacimonadota bacterium]|nr:YggS family pyridoxal phosphate-dependent enzyme [Candidatus Cloacimonadota bacterium]